VTVGDPVSANVQVVLVPLHPPPDQPAKALPAAAVAVRVTFVPSGNGAVQGPPPPQLIPAGLDVTVPAPAPLRATVTCGRKTESLITPDPTRPSGPVALIMMSRRVVNSASAAAVKVRVVESVLPLRTGGFHVAVTPFGNSESLTVTALVYLVRAI